MAAPDSTVPPSKSDPTVPPSKSGSTVPPSKLKVTQVRSTIGTKHNHRASMRTLGLRKIRQSVLREDTPEVRGLIHTVRHLVEVEEVEQ